MDNDVMSAGTQSDRRRPAMPSSIAAAVVAVMGKVRQLGYDENNKFAGYRYVSVDKFYDTIRPLLSDAGLIILIDEVDTEVKKAEGEKSAWLFVRYHIWLASKDGDVYGPLNRSLSVPATGPQAYGSAQSYVEKQFLRALFKVPTGDDDEVEAIDNRPARSALPPQATKDPPPAPPPAPTSQAAQVGEEVVNGRMAFERVRERIRRAETAEHLKAMAGDQSLTADWTLVKRVSPEGYHRLEQALAKKAEEIHSGKGAGS